LLFIEVLQFDTHSSQELGKLLVLLHRNTSASSLAALMKQFDLNHNNKLDFAEFVLFMQSLPEEDETIVEHAVNAQTEAHTSTVSQIEAQAALASITTQAQLLCISVRMSTVIAGSQTGLIFIWDLEASLILFVTRVGLCQAHTVIRKTV
jgi:tetrahydromethanopterin S-methyltransferase subunit F